MIDVEVSGFQSIEHAKIQVEGFTAISGPSNVGKSALVRAIGFALTNARGTYFVRHTPTCLRLVKGTKTCKCKTTVHIKGPGLDLKWEKGDSCNTTTVNGVVHDKPEGVDHLRGLGLDPVKIGSNLTTLQVSDQFEPPFLLSESGAAIAELVADVGQLAVINEAIRNADKDRKEAASLRKTREKDVQDLGAQLACYEGLDTAVCSLDQVEALAGQTKKGSLRVSALNGFLARMEEGETFVKRLEGVEEITPPSLLLGQQLYSRQGMILRLLTQLTVRVQAFKRLEGVEGITLPTITGLDERVLAFNRTSGWLAQLRQIKERFLVLGAVDTIRIPEMVSAEKLPLMGNLSSWATKCSALEGKIQRLAEDVERLTREENAVIGDADALGVCPLCIQPVKGHFAHGEPNGASILSV